MSGYAKQIRNEKAETTLQDRKEKRVALEIAAIISGLLALALIIDDGFLWASLMISGPVWLVYGMWRMATIRIRPKK